MPTASRSRTAWSSSRASCCRRIARRRHPVFIFGLPIGTRVTAVRVRDGVFELPNCDPDKTYRVCIMSGVAAGGLVMVGRRRVR